MGLLTFAHNVTLDGCCDHREMVADEEMLRYWTRVMDAAGAMLFGRRTYELSVAAVNFRSNDGCRPENKNGPCPATTGWTTKRYSSTRSRR
jgi:hypothetical protein